MAPTPIQTAGISLFGLWWRHRRFGPGFHAAVRDFQEREKWGSADWERYQLEALRRTLAHAHDVVPHYRNVLGGRARQHSYTNFRLADLQQIPMLSKEVVRRDPTALLATPRPKGTRAFETSGTTGTPLAIYYSRRMHRLWSAAYEARCRLWASVDHTMSRAMIGGRLVVPPGKGPPFWRYNYAERQLYFSAFHIAPAYVSDYVYALNRFRPDYFVGYASAHYFLASLIEESGLSVHQPRAVLTSSENLLPYMRSTLERVYGCEVFDAYSGVEACCLVSECEHHKMHVSPDVGIIEVLTDDGRRAEPGEEGEIVATGLLNDAQPLIRFRTGDRVVLDDRSCACGRRMPVLREVLGRMEDVVIGQDGRRTVRFHGIFIGVPDVREGQIIQEADGVITLRIAADRDLSDDIKMTMTKRIVDRIGQSAVRFELVDCIPRTSRGKFRPVISRLARPTSSD